MFGLGILMAYSNTLADSINQGTYLTVHPIYLWFHCPLVAVLKLIINSDN